MPHPRRGGMTKRGVSGTGPDIGLAYGVGAYLCWGLMPLYLRLLRGVPILQLLAHRVLWSVLLLVVVAGLLRRLPAIRAAATGRVLPGVAHLPYLEDPDLVAGLLRRAGS